MTIDTEAMVRPLAYDLCGADSPFSETTCSCQELVRAPCESVEGIARAAIAYLLPLIVERCAEESDKEGDRFEKDRLIPEAVGAKSARDAIRALLSAKGGDHE